MTNLWSPLQLRAVLHYYYACDDFTDGERGFVRSLLVGLVNDGLLRECNCPPLSFELTEKGRAFVEQGLLQTPLPIWRMPA